MPRLTAAMASTEAEEKCQVSPWKSMKHLPSTAEEDYLVANVAQLTGLFAQGEQPLNTNELLNNANELEFSNSHDAVREELQSNVFELHDKIYDILNWVVETERFRCDSDSEHEAVCYGELNMKAGGCQPLVESMKKYFVDKKSEQHQHTCSFMAMAAQKNAVWWQTGLLAFGMTTVTLLGAKCVFIDYGRDPEDGRGVKRKANILIDLAAYFLRERLGWHHQNEEVHKNRAVALCGVGALLTSPLCITMFRDSFRACLQESEYSRMQRRANSCMKFLQKNKEMWSSIETQVKSLLRKTEQLKNLKDVARKEMAAKMLYDVGSKLFHLSMSIDIYMVWLDKNGIFPGNVSIPAVVGAERYSKISKAGSPCSKGFFG